MTVRERVKSFIVQNFYVSDPAELTDAASLVGGGWVDSTGMLEIIGFLEADLRVKIADSEMTPENLDSIARIVAFVERKSAAAA